MKIVVVLILAFFIAFAGGCQSTISNTSLSTTGNETSIHSVTELPQLTLAPGTDQQTILTISEDSIEVLNSGLNIIDIQDILGFDCENNSGEQFEEPVLLESDYFNVYDFNIPGIMLFKVANCGKSNISFVECDSDMVTFMGINKDMGFTGIQNCLGPTPVVQTEYGIPGVVSYELRYVINGIKAKFVAWDELGNASWTLKFVSDYNSDQDYIRLSIDQINPFFSMAANALAEYLGGTMNNSGNVEFGGLTFFYKNDKLYMILNNGQYELAGLRKYFHPEMIMEILGETEVFDNFDEDGSFQFSYMYDDFMIMIVYNTWYNEKAKAFDYSYLAFDIRALE